MAIVYLLLLVVIVVGVGALAVYSDSELIPANISTEATTIYNTLTKTDPKGNTVSFKVPDYPTNPQQDNIILTSKNSTEEVISQPDVDRQLCYKTDKNGCIIKGYTKLKHPITGNDIIPYVYNYLITIECKVAVEGFDYCSTEFVSNRGLTSDGGKDEEGNPLGGYFFMKWRPHINTSIAIYDVKIFVYSGILDDVFPEQSVDFNSSYELDLKA